MALDRRAKPKKNFIEVEPLTIEEVLIQEERIKKIKLNQSQTKFVMANFRLVMALELKRTTATFGTHHFCKTHNQLVY